MNYCIDLEGNDEAENLNRPLLTSYEEIVIFIFSGLSFHIFYILPILLVLINGISKH